MCASLLQSSYQKNHTAKAVHNGKTNEGWELLSAVMKTHYDFESYVLLKPIAY